MHSYCKISPGSTLSCQSCCTDITPLFNLSDVSNDKEDKSCIILAWVLDDEAGNGKMRFLDMPTVNIGTAENYFLCFEIHPTEVQP